MDPKHQLTGEKIRLLDSKILKPNQLGSLLALNEDSLHHKCNKLDADDILIYLTIRGGQENPSWFQRLVGYFGLILSFSQGARAFISNLFGIKHTPYNTNDYPAPGRPGDDLRKTHPCEYNARGRSYKGFELSGKRRKSTYQVPSRAALTFEDHSNYVQCQRMYDLTPLEQRMLPSKRDNHIQLRGSTSVQGEDLSDYEVRVAWGQSRKGKKDTKHGYIFNLHPKLDENKQPITSVNCKDPQHQVQVPVSHTGQQVQWHKGQTQFCQKYNRFEIKTNINYMQKADGSFADGGFEKGLTIFDRERNIMCVARPDNPEQANPQKFTIITTFNPSPREIKFYESLSVVIPGDIKSYDIFEKRLNLSNSCSALKSTELTFMQQEEDDQCLKPDIEIVNPELLTNETKTD